MKEENIISKALVSVIVPVYNVEDYVDHCIESILTQTYKNIELILIDDGSTDHSLEHCESWLKKDTRIRILQQENQGQGPARNYGVREANGEYIVFVDSDDFMELNGIELLIKNMDEKTDVVAGAYYTVHEETEEVLKLWFQTYYTHPIVTVEERNCFIRHGAPMPWAKLYRKALFERTDLTQPAKIPQEDVAVFPLIVMEASQIKCINYPVYNWRENRPGNSQNSILSHRKSYLILDKYCQDSIENKKFDIYKNTLFHYSCRRLFYWLDRMKTVSEKNEFEKIKYTFIHSLERYFGENCLKKQLHPLQIGSFNVRWICGYIHHMIGGNNDHVPFLSTISLFYNGKKTLRKIHHPSSFRANCILADQEKSVLESNLSEDKDVIIIDFMNDCQSVICFHDDSILTYSEAYAESDDEEKTKGKIIPYDNKEYESMWQTSCDKMIDYLQRLYGNLPIILLKTRFMEKYQDITGIHDFADRKENQKKNLWISKMEQYFSSHTNQKLFEIDIPEALRLGDSQYMGEYNASYLSGLAIAYTVDEILRLSEHNFD